MPNKNGMNTTERTSYHACPLCEATCGLTITTNGDDLFGRNVTGGANGLLRVDPLSLFGHDLKHMRDRDPQELLGVDAQSGLVRATIQATIISLLILAALTVGPYWWEKSTPPMPSPATWSGCARVRSPYR